MSSWQEIKEIYRRTNKPKDFLFNQWVCRPPAAVLVYLLKDRSITPNQVTFLSLFTALCANLSLVLLRSHLGLIIAAILLQLAFILDCTDGQLARIRGTSSEVGGLLDFLMDEIKAVTLVAAITVRLGLQQTQIGNFSSAWTYFTIGTLGVAVVAVGISITTFIRRPEYIKLLPVTETTNTSRSFLQKIILGAEWLGRSAINYPSWFWLPAFLGKVEWFFIAYLSAHFLYLGKASLSVFFRLGRRSN